ncbi:MAG: AsmA family protein [Arenicella sp.]|nr:AsmA family protein [Arenicella sp.]
MLTIFKWVAGFLLTLALLLAAAAFILPRVFEPNELRDTLVKLIERETDRQLQIDGDLSYSVFPWLGVNVEQLSFSQPPQIGYQDGPMLKVAAAQLRVKLVPLLSRRLEVDTIILQQPQLRMITLADGINSLSGLPGISDQTTAGQDRGAETAVALVVQGVELSDAIAIWDDRSSGDYYSFTELNLNSGNLIGEQAADFSLSAMAELSPGQQPIEFEFDGRARVDTETLAVELKGVKGFVAHGTQSINLAMDALQLDQAQKLRASNVDLTAKSVSLGEDDSKAVIDATLTTSNIGMDLANGKISLQDARLVSKVKMDEQAEIDSTLTAPGFEFNLRSGQFGANDVSINGTFGRRPFEVSAIKTDANLNTQIVNINTVELKSSDLLATLQGLKVSEFIEAPKYSASVELKTFDAARMLEDLEVAFEPADPDALRAVSLIADVTASSDSIDMHKLALNLDQTMLRGNFTASSISLPVLAFDLSLDSLDLDRYMPATANEPASRNQVTGGESLVVPMALFKNVEANGVFRAEKLISGGLEFNDVNVQIKSTQGSVSIVPRAKLYEGKLGGSMDFTEQSGVSTLRIKNEINLVSLGSLLEAADVSKQLTGIGSLVLDLTITERDGEQHNSGTVKLLAKNGAIKGVDVKGIIDKGYEQYLALRGRQVEKQTDGEGQSSANDETRFAELLGTFSISDFNMSNRDFSMKAPLFRIAGEGDIDIAGQTVDYLLNVSVVNTSSGQGGEALDNLRGITLPIRLRGSLLAPKYSLDMKALYKGLLAKEVEQKKSEYLQEKLGIEEGGKLSTKDLLREVLIKKVEEKMGKEEPLEAPDAETEPQNPAKPSPEDTDPASSKSVPDVAADPDTEPSGESSGEAVDDQRTTEEKLKDELKERLLEGLFD